jgi:hypothetical protein
MLLGIKADNFRTVIPSISRPVFLQQTTAHLTSLFIISTMKNASCFHVSLLPLYDLQDCGQEAGLKVLAALGMKILSSGMLFCVDS